MSTSPQPREPEQVLRLSAPGQPGPVHGSVPGPVAELYTLALAARLAAAEGRLAALEGRLVALALVSPDEEAAIPKAEAAKVLGVSVRELERLMRSETDLARCYFRPGKNSQVKFIRRKLLAYRDARV